MSIEACFKLAYPGFSLDVDLTLPSSGITALFGQSGSGKTSLLRAIAGLERVAGGRLVVDGDVWQDDGIFLPTHRRPIGYVFQEASLFAHLNVLDNLRYGMKRITGEQQFNLDKAIGLLGIEHLLDRRPERLSGGERSRVSIARALAVNASLLLMDEPLAALDLRRKREIMPYLERLREELDIPIIYVSHASDEVARLADHIVALDKGRVLASGPLVETLARLDLPIRLGEEVGAILDAVVGEIDEKWHLMRVDFPGGGLWTRSLGLPPGRRVRVHVLARDVSLARQRPEQISIQNVMRGQVDEIVGDDHPGLALVRIRVGDSILLSRLTRRAADNLGIARGEDVWVQIKSVALME
ncbi:MAG: modC [Burkholderiaceae bacterium]|nr:modC [Burkholderiaceae bacterium]